MIIPISLDQICLWAAEHMNILQTLFSHDFFFKENIAFQFSLSLFTPQPSGLEGYSRHGPGGRAVGRAAAKLAEPISR